MGARLWACRRQVRIDHRGQRLTRQIVPSQPGSGEGNETRYCRKLRNVQKLILDEAGRMEGDQNAALRNRKGRCEFCECEMGCPARARVFSSSPPRKTVRGVGAISHQSRHLQRSTQ